ncbi:hypothetical protein NIES2119_13965 [[Phormidium ambiguum] IAM M-71]|uniref:Uncharacterized protein n=1 Tax=[Phormidium ambiguum] IAM M-71 TaxID=454136 RepID=A0A1U7IJR1_9CYAN|nr:hypothetical protein NIES2119_13965 [Phormidium ambiguum IAM M-71]
MYQNQTDRDQYSTIDLEGVHLTVDKAVNRPIKNYFLILIYFKQLCYSILFLLLLFFIVIPLFWLTLLADE